MSIYKCTQLYQCTNTLIDLPWITSFVKRMIRKRMRALLAKFRKLRNVTIDLILIINPNIYKMTAKIISSNQSSKSFLSPLKHLMYSNHMEYIPLLYLNDTFVSDDIDNANLFTNSFS